MEVHKSECHHKRVMSPATLAVSFLAGGIAGAVAGLLLAPRSGRDTRQLVGRQMDEVADSARAMKGQVADRLNEAADSARGMRDRAIRRGRELRDEGTARVEGAVAALAGKDRGNGDSLEGNSPV